MGKPPIETFNKFKDKFYELSRKAGKKQYLVPYLMSSHPGSTLKDAVYLAEYLYKNHMRPEQVQDFLSHARHREHLYVLHRPRPLYFEAGVCGKDR